MKRSSIDFRTLLILLAILALGAALRVYRIDHQSLWLDEGYSAHLSQRPVRTIIEDTGKDVHPPLYYLVLHYWIEWAGDSETALRMPSALAGIAAIWLIFMVGAHLFGPRSGLFAAFLLAISVFHIEHSQEARNYTLMTLFALGSMYFFVSLMRKPNIGRAAGYVLLTLALTYTNLLGLVLILSQWVAVLLVAWLARPPREGFWRHWFTAHAVGVILFLPWVLPTLRTPEMFARAAFLDRPHLQQIVLTLIEYTGSSIHLFLFQFLAILFILRIQPAVALAAQPEEGWVGALERHNWRVGLTDLRQALVLGPWFVLPIAVPFVVSLVWTPVFQQKYAILGSLALYLMCGRALARLQPWPLWVGVLALIALLAAKPIHHHFTVPENENWRELVAEIERKAENDEVVFVYKGYLLDHIYNYYATRGDLNVVALRRDGGLFGGPEDVRKLREQIKNRDGAWLVLSRTTRDAKDDPAGTMGAPRIRELLDASMELRTRRIYHDGRMEVDHWAADRTPDDQ